MYRNNTIAIQPDKSFAGTSARFLETFSKALSSLTFKNKNDNDELSHFLDYIKEGSTVIEAGSHTGAYEPLLRKVAKRAETVIVFESEPDTYYRLVSGKKILNWKNVELEPFLLAGIKGKPSLKFSFSKNDKAVVIDFETGVNREAPQPHTLDSYCKARNIHPHIIRITCNGNEHEIINDAIDTIKKYKPCIYLQCEERNSSCEHIQSLFRRLSDLHYSGFFILDTIKIPIRNFDFNIYQNPRADFYCRHFVFE